MPDKGKAEVRSYVSPSTGRLKVEYSAGLLYFYVNGTEVLLLEPRNEDGSLTEEYLDLIEALMPLQGEAFEQVLNRMFDIESEGMRPLAVSRLARILNRWKDVTRP